jgi:hypothetical protein
MKSFLLKFIKVCPKTGRFRGFKKTTGLAKLLFPLIGIAAIVWILIRVIPKPSRMQYPCMKVAAPIASGFIIYLGGLAAAIFSFKKAKTHFKNSRFGYAILFTVAALAIGSFSVLKSDNDYKADSKLSIDSVFVPTDSANHPIGIAKGIFPGRVVWAYNPKATLWNGNPKTSAWWSPQNTIQDSVTSMLSKSLHAITGKSNDSLAWDAIFKYYNSTHSRGNVGYIKGEKVIIKINLNWSSTGNGSMANDVPISSPQMIYAMIKQLVSNAGVQPSDITIYDLIRYVPDPIYNKLKTEFAGMHFMGFLAGPGRELYVRDTTQIHWAQKLTLEKDTNFSAKGGNPAYLAKQVTQATYMINLAYMKGHRFAGVSLCAKNHVGSLSVDDDNGKPEIWAPHAAGIHTYYSVHYLPASMTWGLAFQERKMGSYNTLVDLMGHKDLGGKTILYIIDGLYAVAHEQAVVSDSSCKWQMAPFNNNWASSILVSQDLVAIESVGVDFYRTEAALNKYFHYTYGNVDNYLHEAALADNPPSGTYYAPSGTHLQSLGVHEHWNNATDKLYSRNIDPVNGKGIELVQLKGTVTSVKEGNNIPSGYSLSQNYPNPFNPTTIIRYQIPKEGFVSIKLYDVAGKEIRTLVNAQQSPGNYSYNIDANRLASGIYIYKISVNNFTQSKKMVLIR